MRKLAFFSLLLVNGTSCERVEYFPDKPISPKQTYILAHKGGGYFDKGNTLEACKHGFTILDGIECDIQKSADNTIWLNHSPLITGCGANEETCFPSLTDKTIIEIDSCLGNKINYTRLEAVFKFMSENYPEKYISLDVKAWNPCELSNVNITRQMNELARSIIALTIKYNLQHHVMVESETGDFLYFIKVNSDFIETYLSTFGDFERGVSRALDAKFTGISYKYKFLENITKEQVDLIHRKGLKLHLWTVDNPADFEEAKSLNPDFIQTDNF